MSEVLRFHAENLRACFAVILLVLSLAGWGGLALRWLGKDLTPGGWALHACVGMAVAIFVGGILCALKLATAPPLILFVLAGCALAFSDRTSLRQSFREDIAWLIDGKMANKVILAIFALFFLFKFYQQASAPWYFFMPADDLQAYLVYPLKILQTGEYGPDPFSERRMSSLGGQPFLLTLLLAISGPRHLRVFDFAACVAVYSSLVVTLCRAQGVTPRYVFFLLAYCLFCAPTSLNLTAGVSAAALFLLFFWLLLSLELQAARKLILIGLIGAALSSMKATLGLPVSIAVALVLGRFLVREPLAVFRAWAIVGGVAILSLLPWMFQMHASNGTWFYPFLGKGYHGLAYGLLLHDPWTAATATAALSWMVQQFHIDFAALPIVAAFRKSLERPTRAALFLIGLTAVVSELITEYKASGYAERYSLSYAHAGIILACIFLMRGELTSRFVRFAANGMAVIFTVLSLLQLRDEAPQFLLWAKWNAWHPDQSKLISVTETASYKAAQDSVPAGAPVLAHVAKAFAFDFRRNPIWLCDLPGGSSPPPGMPIGKDKADELRAYLLKLGVRHVMFSYADRAWLNIHGKEVTHETQYSEFDVIANPWIRHQLIYMFEFQESLFELSKKTAKVFDDGRVFVLDLAAPN